VLYLYAIFVCVVPVFLGVVDQHPNFEASIESLKHTLLHHTQTHTHMPHAPYAGMPRTLGAFKAEGIAIIREFFASSDFGEVVRR